MSPKSSSTPKEPMVISKAVLSRGMISLLVIISLSFALATIVQPGFTARYVRIITILWITTFILLALMNEANLRVISLLYVAFLLVMIVAFSWTGGGVKGHGISLFPLVIAFAALSVNRKQIWVFSVAAAAGGLFLTIAYYIGWLPVKEALGSSPVIYWVYSLTSIFAITYVEFLSVNRLQKALGESKKELQLRRESEKKYKRIVDSFQDIYYQTDMTGKVIMITPSVKTRAGYEPSEVIGKNVAEFYSDPVKKEDFLVQLRTLGSVYDYDLDLVSKTGEIVNTVASSRIIYNESGEAVGIEGSLHDITLRKRAENDLKLKNDALMEIAFLQSHIVRAPIANILGIIHLINTNEPNDPMNLQLIPKLEVAAKQLDSVVHQIVKKTNEVRNPAQKNDRQ